MYVDDPTRIRHMCSAIQDAVGFVQGRTRESLDSDRMLATALVHCVEIVGEAARQVSRNYQNAHPEIPWKRLADARNELTHHYYDIDCDAVWASVTQELPALLPTLVRLSGDTAAS